MDTDVKPRSRRYASDLRQHQAELTRRTILEAARTLFVARGYPAVTMQEVARAAGVSYQTLYSQFGGKLQLAIELCDLETPHVGPTVAMLDDVDAEADPVAWLHLLATFARRLYEPCAEVLRFMRQSGDADLQARYRAIQAGRFQRLTGFAPRLVASGRLSSALAGAAAIDVAWSLTSPETYESYVLDRGWSADRFEAWLSAALVQLLLTS